MRRAKRAACVGSGKVIREAQGVVHFGAFGANVRCWPIADVTHVELEALSARRPLLAVERAVVLLSLGRLTMPNTLLHTKECAKRNDISISRLRSRAPNPSCGTTFLHCFDRCRIDDAINEIAWSRAAPSSASFFYALLLGFSAGAIVAAAAALTFSALA